VALVLVAGACSRSDDKGSGSGSTSSTTGGTSGAKSADFGDLKDVCQGGTPTEIKIATLSDPGFVGRPGLNQELFDTADVFAAWCNDRGGINGRTIAVDKLDAALTNTKAQMTTACAQD